jgi:hypothetical protein
MTSFNFDYTFHLQIYGFEECNSSKPGLPNILPVEINEAALSCLDVYEVSPSLLLFLFHNTRKKSCKFKYKEYFTSLWFYSLKILRIKNDKVCDIIGSGQRCQVGFRIWTANRFEFDTLDLNNM